MVTCEVASISWIYHGGLITLLAVERRNETVITKVNQPESHISLPQTGVQGVDGIMLILIKLPPGLNFPLRAAVCKQSEPEEELLMLLKLNLSKSPLTCYQ